MAGVSKRLSDFCNVSPEIFTIILSNLPTKTVLNLRETCRYLRDVVASCDMLWKNLCMEDFQFDLQAKGPFKSFAHIYEMIYKYRLIVQNTRYGTYVPEYFYHWSVLLEEGTSGKLGIATGFLRCRNGRLKKAWEIKESQSEDFSILNKHKTLSIIKAKLGVKGRSEFQNVVLQRCIRNQKKVNQHFLSSSMRKRVSTLRNFLYDNPKMKNLLLGDKPIPEIIKEMDPQFKDDFKQMPNTIGWDFIRGNFNRTGLIQVKNYVEFVQFIEEMFKKSMVNTKFVKILEVICNVAYEKKRKTAKMMLVTDEDFCACIEDYFNRIQEIETWRSEITVLSHFKFMFLNLKSKEAYRSYILHGEDLPLLKNYYEGLIRIQLWLKSHKLMPELLGDEVLSILGGSCSPDDTEDDDGDLNGDLKAIEDCMAKYLKSAKNIHFKKLIQLLWQYASIEHEKRTDFLNKLEKDLQNKNVAPPRIEKPPKMIS